MESVDVYVGLDYHKDSVQVCALNKKGDVLLNKKCRNESREIIEAVNRIGRVPGAKGSVFSALD